MRATILEPETGDPRRSLISSGDPRAGFTLLELMTAITLMAMVLLIAGRNFLDFSRAFTSLTKLTHDKAQSQAIMDRLVDELITGKFTSIAPAVPVSSPSIQFQKITGVVNGVLVFGNPVNIDLVPLESDVTDGVDNNGNGLIDESALRIWEDLPPYGPTPSPPDNPVILTNKVAKDGLKFTRQGSILLIDLTLQDVIQPGDAPKTILLHSGVKMRNP